MAETRLSRAALIGLLLFTCCVYLPSLQSDFVYDDWRFIVDNPYMRSPMNPVDVFFDADTMDSLPVHDIYRPIRTLMFRIEFAIGGEDAWLHHLINLCLHLANTALLYIWLSRLLAAGVSGRPGRSAAPLFGAAVFALHPVQVESVAWISSRSDLLVVFFLLLLLIHIARRPARLTWVGSLITILLSGMACLSKESGTLGWALIALTAMLIPAQPRRVAWCHAALACCTAAGYLWLRAHAIGGLEGQVPLHGGGFASNLSFALYGLMNQIALLFQGSRLSVEYPPPAGQAFSGEVIVPALGFILLTAVCVALLLRSRSRTSSMGFLVFYLGLLPTSSLVYPMKSLVNDRYLYLPMMGIALLLGALFSAARARAQGAIKGLGIAATVLGTVLAVMAFVRCQDWRNEESLWSATLEANPGSIKARVGLSRLCFNSGRTAAAAEWAGEAIALSLPGSAVRNDALHLAASAANRAGRKREAADYLRQALDEGKRSPEAHTFVHHLIESARNLWALEMETERYQGAIEAARDLIRYEGETSLNRLLLNQAQKALDEAGGSTSSEKDDE